MLNKLIEPMAFEYIRDAVCEMLAKERDNQLLLAKETGYTKNQIEQNFDFTIYPKRFRCPDIEEMPCVYVYFTNMNFPQDGQFTNENQALANLNIDYYCVGKSENGFTADENAEDRLMYLTSQLYNILFSETNLYSATEFINHVLIKNWKRISTPDELNQAATVLGASFSIELGFIEKAFYCNTFELKELYFNIRDEFKKPLLNLKLI